MTAPSKTVPPQLALPRPRHLGALPDNERHALLTREADNGREVETAVRGILDRVKADGDAALLEFTERFDKVRPARLLLGPKDFEAALAKLDPPLRRALQRAAANLRKVAVATRPPPSRSVEVEPGLVVEERFEPLARVGCYVPGGKAAYPSSVLMTVVPAKAAGVPEVIVASPPSADGRPAPVVLAACAIAGADACLAAGGAQAVAALAYGTKTVPAVDKIVGPGNRYVTAAKRLVFGPVGIDSPAGPTEVVVLADASADPRWVALDLVAQAEHAEDSRAILVTPDAALAEAVAAALPALVAAARRADVVRAALSRHGAILIAADVEEACAFVRDYAPEHLEVMTKDPERWADLAKTAATTFLGPYAPVAAGDYLTGADHVLPTGGAARWAAPLGVHDFLVRRTRQHIDVRAARAIIDDLHVLADAEGLPAHGAAMAARGNDPHPLDFAAERAGRKGGAR